MERSRVVVAAALLLGSALVTGAQTPAAPAASTAPSTVKKIVFLAGPKDHGAVGRHEYEKDLRELAWQLEKATNLRESRPQYSWARRHAT